jgi:hypothetical protein
MRFKKLSENLNLEEEDIEVVFLWDTDKNQKLKNSADRNFKSFEDVVLAILEDRLLDILDNPNYPNQVILVVKMGNYIYAVPTFLEIEKDKEGKTLFVEFKTLYPSRKLLKKYKGGIKND